MRFKQRKSLDLGFLITARYGVRGKNVADRLRMRTELKFARIQIMLTKVLNHCRIEIHRTREKRLTYTGTGPKERAET